MWISSGSAAKWTRARFWKRNSGALGSRSCWYCRTALRQVWPVIGFFSSQVATGTPLSAKSRSMVSPLPGWHAACRVTVRSLRSNCASASGLSPCAGRNQARRNVWP